MNGKKAKRIRKLVFGDKPTNMAGRRHYMTPNGQIIASKTRMLYQKAKKVFKEGQ